MGLCRMFPKILLVYCVIKRKMLGSLGLKRSSLQLLDDIVHITKVKTKKRPALGSGLTGKN